MKMSSLRLFIFAIAFIACLPVYETVICAFNICSFVPDCKNGGTCKSNNHCKARCICPPGYNGTQCEHPSEFIKQNCKNECTPTTCHNHGNCTFDKESCNTECNCETGYSGTYCNRQKCSSMVCVHGTCQNISKETFQCKCDDNWIGHTCNIRCSRNCSEGTCIIQNGQEICSCWGKYLPSTNCTKEESVKVLVTEWDKRYLGFLAIPLLFSIVLAILFYVMWRYRFTFILKIIYTFQNYEDHDGKEYDAFISFRSTTADENWVFNTLFPTLENEMGFKLCVHFRDFIVGETISNNIINAIEKSRRTILVLSPDYVISEWTRMEYQVAHQEMMKKRQKIIPIIFRDINMLEIDKSLTYILDSITYLEWPQYNGHEDRKFGTFWKKLRLTMPKKRETKLSIEDGKEVPIYALTT